jgi:uncharacterized protein YjbI with pentapeptide repeats
VFTETDFTAADLTNVIFENCTFTGATYGIYNQVNTKGVSIANSNFNTLYQGIV